MSDNTVKDNRSPYSGNSQYNAIAFMIENAIKQQVSTADIVTVVSVDAGGVGPTGTVTVRPLVCQIDGFGQVIPPTELFSVPYSRVQGGTVALVCDPEPGDVGIVVYAKRDSSNVGTGQTDPVQPGSFRMFDQSDGFYIGGFKNKEPTVYIELTQDGNINITAPTEVVITSPAVTIDCDTFAVNASSSIELNSPSWGFTGVGGGANGGSINGSFEISGDIVFSGNTTYRTHEHGGVQTGAGNTGVPQ